MVGVTGTNGKTSCAHWIAHALEHCGRRAAILGTLGNGLVGALAPAPNTTPDACVLHELLAQLRHAGAQAVAMEVSSHGLDQGRVNGVAFDVALFTNLSRDHLDYHGTMAAYGAAKARLFAWPDCARWSSTRTTTSGAASSTTRAGTDAASSRMDCRARTSAPPASRWAATG
jgi:UDP-N-acetylmuramoyl-L-alanyl-D-glutamate--2,6-diaminopimelate ligase